MEQILKEHERLEKKANLGKAIDDVVKIIDQLKAAKEQVATSTQSAQELIQWLAMSLTIHTIQTQTVPP